MPIFIVALAMPIVRIFGGSQGRADASRSNRQRVKKGGRSASGAD
jgi:hypothetical protein